MIGRCLIIAPDDSAIAQIVQALRPLSYELHRTDDYLRSVICRDGVRFTVVSRENAERISAHEHVIEVVRTEHAAPDTRDSSGVGRWPDV